MKDGQTTPHAQAVCCCHQPPQQSGPGTASTCVLVDHLNPCAGHLHDWLQGHSITPVTVWCRCWRQHTGSHLLLSPPPSSASSCCCQAGSNTPAAVAALSRWARACCNQAQPQVTLSPLVKALLEVWVRFQGGCLLICQPRSVMHMPYTKCICHLYQTHTFKHHCVGVTQFGGRSPVTPPSANAGYIDPMRCCCKFCVCVALMDHCIGTHDAHGRCC